MTKLEQIARKHARMIDTTIDAAILAAMRELREVLARLCEERAEARCHEYGAQDQETGAWDLRSDLESLNEEDDDCAAAIRRWGEDDEPQG